MTHPLRILTIDLEDWFHLLEHPDTATEASWRTFESRLSRNTERLLELFAAHRVKATFFSLGWVARKHPDVVKRVLAAGHELASHSDVHTLVHQQSPEAFRAETLRSLRALEDVSGAPIRYYRAPGFSITRSSSWAFEILHELGIECDLSLYPGDRAHGGFAGVAQNGPMVLRRNGIEMRELPMTVAGVSRLQVAYAGGGYFRLLPYSLIRRLCERSDYVMTYFHPRDFDRGQPVLPRLSRARRFKSYVGLGGAFAKLDRLLDAFRFVSVGQAVTAVAWDQVARFDV